MQKRQLDLAERKALCIALGLTESHATQRIILDIETDGTVAAYTKAMLKDENFDAFNVLMNNKPIPATDPLHFRILNDGLPVNLPDNLTPEMVHGTPS